MKKKSLFLVLFGLYASPLFAATAKADSTLNSSLDLKPLQTVFLILKVACVAMLVFFILKTVIQVLKAEAQQRGQILMHNLIYIAVAGILTLCAFKIPTLMGLDDVFSVDDKGSAVVRSISQDNKGLPTKAPSKIEELEEELKQVKKQIGRLERRKDLIECKLTVLYLEEEVRADECEEEKAEFIPSIKLNTSDFVPSVKDKNE